MNVKVLEVNVDDQIASGVFTLVKNVIFNKKDGIKIDIGAYEKFVDPEHIRMFNDAGTEIYWVGYDGNKIKKQFECFKNLKSLCKKNEYDHVHIHGDVANKLLVMGCAAKAAGVKNIIFHSHASDVDGHHRTFKRICHKACRRFLRSIGNCFVSCSDLAAEWMFPNIPSKDIIIVNNGIELDKYRFNSDAREKQRKDLGVENEILIGHVGRFSIQKNHEYLIGIIKELRSRHKNARLLLVGDGPEKDRIKQMAQNENIEDSVIFYGVSDNVPSLLSAMDVFVLPSLFEGLPIAGVEAQAAGLPVIFSDKITESARLTDNVTYLPIDAESIAKWTDEIEKSAGDGQNREDAYTVLKEKCFDIKDTVNSFFKLYGVN